jgi:aldehyde:ferredoxin oxidoreductase
MSNRANGRTGLGAVMGSKNLKAVAVRGKTRPTMADKVKLNQIAKWGADNLSESDIAGLSKYGTADVVSANQTTGTLPTYNYNSGVFDKWEAIDGTTTAVLSTRPWQRLVAIVVSTIWPPSVSPTRYATCMG